jgi:nitrate reductase gamma subunit
MMTVIQIAAYLGLAVFAIAVAVRIVVFSKMPMHIRWELYPVPHEGKRAEHGGSYLEEVNWWMKPRHKSHLAELRAMAAEILFLVALREHNRPLWRRSYPFHLGLYFVIGATALMMAEGVATLVAPSLLAGSVAAVLQAAIVGFGSVGLALGTLGALGLLVRRLSRPELQEMTVPADYFNLVLFVVTFGWAFATFLFADRDFSAVRGFVQDLVAFSPAAFTANHAASIMVSVSVVLLAALVAYIPMTHMSHFIGKYFAYHSIRWNDEPNLPGGDQEQTIQRLLGQNVSWAAPHIKGGGKKNWVQVATEDYKK